MFKYIFKMLILCNNTQLMLKIVKFIGEDNGSSTLAWRIPWTEEPGGLESKGCKKSDMTEWLWATVQGLQKVRHDCGSLFSLFLSIVAMSIGIQCFPFFEYIVISRSANVVWEFYVWPFEKLTNGLRSSCTILCSHQQRTSIPIPPDPCQHCCFPL